MNDAPQIEEAVFYGWKGYRLVCGPLAIGVAPDLGGRIISLTHEGTELLFVQQEHLGEVFDLDGATDLRALKRRLGFRLWGGDKTWIAPQSSWWEGIPPLDLDAGRYRVRVDGDTLSMESPACRETSVRLTRRITLRPGGVLILDQEIENTGADEISRGIWDVTQCLRAMDVYLPSPAQGVRAYPEEGDSVALSGRLLREKDGWTEVPCRLPQHFKFGTRTPRGAVVALRPLADRVIAMARRFAIDAGAPYAHDAIIEVYNSPEYNYLEIEVHAPLRQLRPGERQTHRQAWWIGSVAAGTGPEAIMRMASQTIGPD
ncbi:MAG: hypothetical protein O7A63_05170 [Acidobacteria bacterium]|nr:hypothetical protein [Acidobacteriota bacterium]